MSKAVMALFIFTFIVQSVLSNNSDLEIRLLNEKRKEVTAGFNSNVLIMFTNHANTEKEFQLKFNTPDNSWIQIADYSSIIIEKNSSLNKIIGIHIPKNAKVGNYSIELEAFEKPDNKSFGKVNIPIYVKPRYGIRVDKLKAPRYLFSGDTTSVRFLIQNLSNLDVGTTATIVNGRDAKISYINIQKDSAVIIKIPVSIPKEIRNYTQYNVSIISSINENPETVSSTSYCFDIFPSGNVKFDGYNRFPIMVSGIYATSNRFGNRDFSTMYDIRGDGFLSEDKNRRLDFHLRGPDRSGNPLFGLNDEYYLTYSSRRTELSLGDNNYRLSDLTESSRNGRGVKFQYNLEKLSFGSYMNIPRYYPEIKLVYSFYTNYRLNQNLNLSFGFLSKTDTMGKGTRLITFSGSIKRLLWGMTEFELAAGQRQNEISKAYKVSYNFNRANIASYFSYTNADPKFPGFISNSVRISSGINANLKKKLTLSLNYNLNNSNLALDTLYANAPISKSLNFVTGYRINSNNSVNLGAFSMGFKDKAPKPLFNYNKYYGRIALQSKYKRLNVNIQGELGKIEDFLEIKNGELTDFYNGYLTMNYTFNQLFSANGFVNYQGGKKYLITGFDKFYYGSSIKANLKDKAYVSIDYNSNYELKDYYRDRSLLTLQMYYQLNKNHSFSFGTNYNLVKNSLDKKELGVQFRYTYTINAPLSKKKDVGSLIGKITNNGTEKAGGIILNLNGNVAMTDKEGNFKFTTAKVGTYILAIDESSLGLNTIAEIPGPYRVTIEPGKVTRFELALTKAAKINGSLVVQEDEMSGKKGYYPVKEEIEKLIIEASCGSETFRILTATDGTFCFSDLRPGIWHVKVYHSGIPQGYQLMNDQFNINLSSGKEEKLDVIIRKKTRQIKFQKNY